MTRRKKRQPVRVSDIKQEKEDGLVLPKQQTETTGHDATSLSIDCNKSLETKVFLNGHHKLKDVFENNEEDRNGNTLVDARLKDDGEDGEVSHSLRNNCKLQLSKVRVENFCKVNPEVEESKLANKSNDLSISEGNLNDEITYNTTDFISERDDNIGNEMVQSEVILGGGEGDVEDGKEVVREDGAISSYTDGQYHIEESTGIPDLEAGSDTPTGDSPVKMEDLESEAEFSKAIYKRRRPMETPEDFICQLCQMIFDNPRDLTVHIRGHNEASSHTCNICSKKLSSASSLDRHMLIHSGERPFQCPMCDMSFTTNGNMNRHLRTHEKGSKEEQEKTDKSAGPQESFKGDEAAGSLNLSLLSTPKRARMDFKRLQTYGMSSGSDMNCPVCHKSFICRIGFETHMTFHPDMTLNCVFCNLSFRNQRGLRMHLYKVHKKDAIGGNGTCKSSGGSPLKKSSGIDELCAAEFSTTKFPHIAQLWCEENSLNMNGDVRTSVCLKCKKVFPCMAALNLHISSLHGGSSQQSLHGPEKVLGTNRKIIKDEPASAADEATIDLPKSPKDSFMNALSLQPSDECEDSCPRNCSPQLSGTLSNKYLETAGSSNYANNSHHLVNRDGLWKGFPILNFEQASREVSGRSGRPLPQSFSPLKGEMASGAPKKPSVEIEDSSKMIGDVAKAHGPLSRRQDAEPVTGDVGVGMLTPAEFASANSHIDEDELERERMMTEDSDGWNDGSSGQKFSHVCKFCSKAFPFRSTLKVHVRSHMGLTPYKCMLCDYSSADKSTLVRHMRTHSGERPYSCKLCGFPFTTKANCERHVKKRHAKLSKLDIDVNIQHHPLQRLPEQGQFRSPDTICKICNRDFKFFRDLQNHMRIHEKSPSKIFACIKCNMNFSKKNQCVRHMLRKHRHLSSSEIQQHVQSLNQKEEKSKVKKEEDISQTLQPLEEEIHTFEDSPFANQTHLSRLPRPVPVYVSGIYKERSSGVQEEPLDLSLPKIVSFPSFMSPDIPSTSNYSPDVGSAGGAFTTAEGGLDNAEGAMRYKDPYRKFYSPRLDSLVCPHCLRLFKKGSRLKTHIRSHTRERPFRCSMCSAAFTQSSSLDEHMIKRHCEEEDSDQREIKSGVTPMQLKLINRDHSHISILKNCLQRKEEEGTMGENLRETDVVDSSNTETSASSHQSDSNVDLSSISKMLAATDSNKFQHFMSPQVNRQNFADQPPSQLNKNVEMSIDADGAEDVMINQERKLVIDTSKADSENVHGDHQHQIKEEGDADDFMKFSRSGKLESRQTCPYCQRKFPWVSSLRRHLITHTGLKPYECPHCGATFSTKSNCERHINRRHQGQKEGEVEVSDLQKDPFKCKECRELAFSTRRKLQKHYKDDHPLVPFPKEYMEAPDVIVNNKDLIEKIQQGYDPVLSSSVSGIIPEGTKKRNQLFFGSQSQVDREPIDQLLEEKNNEDSSSVHTNNSYMDQGGDELMEPVSYHESESAFPETGGASPFLVKVENGLNGYSTLIEKRELLPGTPLKMDKEPGSLPSDEAFSDRNISEDDGCENSDSDSHVSTAAGDGQMMLSMVGDLSGAASLVIPQVTLSGKKGKKGARFSCDQCCKKFKSELTLCRHLKVHQLEHPFNCTECSATFTTKFNCQRHIMKLHGKRKEDVMSITGCGKVSEPGVQKAPSSSSNPPKQVTIDPSSSQVLFSYSTNVGLAPAVVKILPKKPLNDHVITPSKKISKQKIKNILPKLGSSKAKRQGHIDHSSSVSQLLTPYQNNVHFSNGQLFIKEELDASSEDAGVDGKPVDGSWNYSSIQSSASDDTGMVVEGDMTGCNSDIIKDLLGIQDSSTMDQILESADSAAKILGVQG